MRTYITALLSVNGVYIAASFTLAQKQLGGMVMYSMKELERFMEERTVERSQESRAFLRREETECGLSSAAPEPFAAMPSGYRPTIASPYLCQSSFRMRVERIIGIPFTPSICFSVALTSLAITSGIHGLK